MGLKRQSRGDSQVELGWNLGLVTYIRYSQSHSFSETKDLVSGR